MPRRKKGRRKVSLVTKLINGALLALALARPIQIWISSFPVSDKVKWTLQEATAGLGTDGKLDLKAAGRMYGPMGAAFVLKKAISWLRKSMRV